MQERMIAMKIVLAAALSCLLVGCTDPAAIQEEAASSRSQIVNMPAPDFTLPDQDAKPVSLKSLQGQWVVLYFYPQDDTPGCTCEATEFTKVLESFQQMKARIYGISPIRPRRTRRSSPGTSWESIS